LLLVFALWWQQRDAKDKANKANVTHEQKIGEVNGKLDSANRELHRLKDENDMLKKKPISNQPDISSKPSDDRASSDLLAELQAACVNSDFVKLRFALTVIPPAKPADPQKSSLQPKFIFHEIKKTCKLTNQEPRCEAAVLRLEDSFIKSWSPKRINGDIFLPESCVKEPLIRGSGYSLKLSRVSESSAAQTIGSQESAPVGQYPRPQVD